MFSEKDISFSQAEGLELIPQPLALGELPERARNFLWSHIYEALDESKDFDGLYHYLIGNPWRRILYDYHVSFLFEPADEFSHRFDTNVANVKDLFLHQPYNEVFDFVQFVLRHRLVPDRFSKTVDVALKKFLCAYAVIEDGPTIVPISSPEQRDSLRENFKVLESGPFEGARSHFRKSAECINKDDMAGSIRESIHGVESIARRLDENAATSLKPALKALVAKGVVLHPAFKKGVENLYGYTGDEDGIRHALLETDANVGMEEAVFMFGACTSFSSYLVNKARKSGLLE